MRSARTRMSKNYDLAAQLQRYSAAIESDPRSVAGRWARACYPLPDAAVGAHFDEVRIDLGCGKGAFTVEMARRFPHVLFVGIETEPLCIAYAARKAEEAGIHNAVFVPSRDDAVEFFGDGEVSWIYLNFSTPYARKRDTQRRLTYAERLMQYRRILTPEGRIRLKTDSYPLRDYTLSQLEVAGYELEWSSDDMRAFVPDDPETEYEHRLVASGAVVYGCQAVIGPSPATEPALEERSLFDYLPDDLSTITYVPLGMEGAVENLRNAARKRRQV